MLSDRDAALLCAAFQHRALRRDQAQALFFASLTRCSERLRRLFDHGYLRRHFPEEAPYGAQAVYTLGAKAVPLVARHLDRDEREVREVLRASPTPAFLAHTLAITDFYLAVRDAAGKRPDVKLALWLPETECRHEYEIRSPGGAWRTEVFRPDGFLRLERQGRLLAFFLEIDRGNAGAPQWKGKAAEYRRYREAGIFSDVYGQERFRVLSVTTGERRLDNLREAVRACGAEGFLFSTFAEVARAGPLSAVWRDAGGRLRSPLEDA